MRKIGKIRNGNFVPYANMSKVVTWYQLALK